MANISISDLHPAGSALFSDSESFMSFMKDLSEDELKITGGGGGGSGKKSGKKSGSKKSGKGSGCGCY